MIKYLKNTYTLLLQMLYFVVLYLPIRRLQTNHITIPTTQLYLQHFSAKAQQSVHTNSSYPIQQKAQYRSFRQNPINLMLQQAKEIVSPLRLLKTQNWIYF